MGSRTAQRKDTGLAENDLPPLIAALGDKDEVVRLNAAYELGTIGASAVPELIETWREASEDTASSGSESGEFPTRDLCVECDWGTGSTRIDRHTTR